MKTDAAAEAIPCINRNIKRSVISGAYAQPKEVSENKSSAKKSILILLKRSARLPNSNKPQALPATYMESILCDISDEILKTVAKSGIAGKTISVPAAVDIAQSIRYKNVVMLFHIRCNERSCLLFKCMSGIITP
jgi:hypothetical protein